MWHALEHGITCIDSGYIRDTLAACYLVRRGDEAAIIETGTSLSVPRVLAVLRAQGIAPEQVRYIIPTHVHLDHAGGAGARTDQNTETVMNDEEELIDGLALLLLGRSYT